MKNLKSLMNAVKPVLGQSDYAQACWQPIQRELDALASHDYVEGICRVDQIWDWLKINHGNVVAVDAPHGNIPERYTYGELAELISKAATGFKTFGVGNGDVVALFAENSPRWLIADQGILRVGAANAVRGALAPIEELRYILDDSASVALVVQSAEL